MQAIFGLKINDMKVSGSQTNNLFKLFHFENL